MNTYTALVLQPTSFQLILSTLQITLQQRTPCFYKSIDCMQRGTLLAEVTPQTIVDEILLG